MSHRTPLKAGQWANCYKPQAGLQPLECIKLELQNIKNIDYIAQRVTLGMVEKNILASLPSIMVLSVTKRMIIFTIAILSCS